MADSYQLYRDAHSAFRSGKDKTAIKMFTEYLSVEKDTKSETVAAAYGMRGTSYNIIGEKDKAIADLKKAADLGSGRASIFLKEKYNINYFPPSVITKEKITLKDGSAYEGDFVYDLPHGRGKLTWTMEDGEKMIYEGNFFAGKIHGKGKKTWCEHGDTYEGDFVDGEPHGKGVLIYVGGNKYESDFVDGLPNGKGKLTYSDGGVYTGDLVNGEPHGRGKMVYADGSAEDGNWKDGEFVGGSYSPQKPSAPTPPSVNKKSGFQICKAIEIGQGL